MKITMIGHSTVLIELEGQKILTDPYFSSTGNLAYARPMPPARTCEELVDVDLVLLSHMHFDHVDRHYFKALPVDTPVIAPAQTAWLTKLLGARNVLGIKVWENREFGKVKVTAVPAKHLTFTVGYVIQGEGKSLYFAGDTFYGPFMMHIARKYHLHAALLPVMTYRIAMTMGEKDAVRAVLTLKPKFVIPIHLGLTPRSSILSRHESPENFVKRLRDVGSLTQAIVLNEGESWKGAR